MSLTIFNTLVPADTFTYDNFDFFRISPSISVTAHPIEFGVDVSDHAQVGNLNLSGRARVSSTPQSLIPEPFRLELAQAFLERNEGKLMTIVSPIGVFANVIITRFSRAKTIVNELVFDLTMVQIRLASAISVPIPPRLPAPPQQVSNASPQDAGAQPTPPAPPPPPPDLSLLKTLFGVAAPTA